MQSDLAPLLPLRCEVDTVQLITSDGKDWRERDEYRLGPEGPRSDEGDNSLA